MGVVTRNSTEPCHRPTGCAEARSFQWDREFAPTARCGKIVLPRTGRTNRSGRGESVVLQQSAERLMADNVLPTEVFHRFARRQVAGDGHIAQALMRAKPMIIGEPRIEDVPKVPLAENDEVVQHLVLGALHPGLGEWVHVRTPRRNRPELNAVVLQNRTELGGELAVAVADDVRRSVFGRLFGEDDAHVSRGLGHPNGVGIGRHPGNVNAAGVEVDEEQDVERDRPAHRPHGLGEEVGSPNCFQVPLNEFVLGSMPSFRARLKAVFLEDAGDGRTRDMADAQLFEIAEDAFVAPAGGLGHLDNELADLLRFPGPTSPATLHSRFLFACPAGKGPGMDDGNDFLDLRAEPQAELQQLGPLRRSDLDSFGQLAAKNPVFRLEVLDHLDEFFFGGPGQNHQEGVEKSLHAGTMRKSLPELEVACF